MAADGFVRGLHNASFVASLISLPSYLGPLRPASAQFDYLLDLSDNFPPAAPPPGVGGDYNYTGLSLAPFQALTSSCIWSKSLVGQPLEITLPTDRLYVLYNVRICVPLLFSDGTLQMVSLEIEPSPITEVDISVNLATCERWLPPPLAPPPTAPPELRPTEYISFELGFSTGLVAIASEAQTRDLVGGVSTVFQERLVGVAPAGFNATVTVLDRKSVV